ncbi:MAG TPA: hypothetical protein VHT53_00320, partial [Candidatus Elarobacter sp.]|nr:hypothetical protein [Candidatus Elarobacter sp.]
MSLPVVTIAASAVLTLLVLGIVAVVVFLNGRMRGGAGRTLIAPAIAPPKPWVRALYGAGGALLAFAIVTTGVILLFAGPCGLDFGLETGGMLLAFGGFVFPLVAAALGLILG